VYLQEINPREKVVPKLKYVCVYAGKKTPRENVVPTRLINFIAGRTNSSWDYLHQDPPFSSCVL